MSIEATVYTALTGAAAVTAITSTRIYSHVAPEGTAYPLIVYNATAENPVTKMGSTRESGMRNKTIQIDCWTKTAADGVTLADAVRAAMYGMSTASAVRLSQTSTYDPQTLLFKTSIDFSVWATA